MFKNNLSIGLVELDALLERLRDMDRDIIDWQPKSMPATTTGQGNATQIQHQLQQQQSSQPAPFNLANLEENTRALEKISQSNSKSGQPTTAPTSAQPSFSPRAASPHIVPTYAGRATIMQEDLQLPPAGKRRKTGS